MGCFAIRGTDGGGSGAAGQRTCADVNANGDSTEFDCHHFPEDITPCPDCVTCVANLCTGAECCTGGHR